MWWAACIGLALLGYAFVVEPNWLEVNIQEVKATAAVGRIRVAQISDLHLQGFGRREATIIEQLQSIKPDLIIFSGDVIDRADALPALDGFLSAIGSTPKVAVLGNWEYWGDVDLGALRQLYEEKHGMKLLVNQVASYQVGGRNLDVVGMDDFTAGMPDQKLLDRRPSRSTAILIEHSPGFFEETSVVNLPGKFDLCLSGHTHGGQITFFGKPVWTPRGSGAFYSAFYQTTHCPLYVSRGLGTSVLPARFGARPEVAVFDL